MPPCGYFWNELLVAETPDPCCKGVAAMKAVLAILSLLVLIGLSCTSESPQTAVPSDLDSRACSPTA